jgi:hypothetical protein
MQPGGGGGGARQLPAAVQPGERRSHGRRRRGRGQGRLPAGELLSAMQMSMCCNKPYHCSTAVLTCHIASSC